MLCVLPCVGYALVMYWLFIGYVLAIFRDGIVSYVLCVGYAHLVVSDRLCIWFVLDSCGYWLSIGYALVMYWLFALLL